LGGALNSTFSPQTSIVTGLNVVAAEAEEADVANRRDVISPVRTMKTANLLDFWTLYVIPAPVQ
jgi:hypothetical protein